MARSDLDAPARVSQLSAATSPSGSRRRCVPFLLVFLFAFPGARQCRAQERTEQSQDQVQSQTLDQNSSVADAARQERARKQNQQKKASHVYTAEDLRREHILTPKDRGDLTARKNQQPAAPAGPQILQDGGVGGRVHAARPPANSAEVSLGDMARRMRREKNHNSFSTPRNFLFPSATLPCWPRRGRRPSPYFLL